MEINVINDLVVERNSGIHNRGVFSRCFIPKGMKIIEYVGEKISKKESERRADLVLDESKKNSEKGAVYIFDLNKRFDLDGNVSYNYARFINHSCSPNCESENIDNHIWIVALRDIFEGEELTYNYGYDIDNFDEHPCLCGSSNCMGFIADEKKWSKLKNLVGKKFKNKKVLVAYYSRSGNTKKVAEFLANYFGFDLDEIKSGSRDGVFGFALSGFESVFNKKPEINFSRNPDDYDLVILGTPIWANTLSSPVRSYLSNCRNVDVAAFSTLGGDNFGRVFNEFSLGVPFFKGMTHIKACDVENNRFQYKIVNFFRTLNLN